MKRYEALRSVTLRAKRYVTLRYTYVLRKQGDRYEALQYERSVTLRYVTLLF